MTEAAVILSALLAGVCGLLLVLQPRADARLLPIGGLLFAIWMLLFVPVAERL